jgi:hypothetical protein
MVFAAISLLLLPSQEGKTNLLFKITWIGNVGQLVFLKKIFFY